MSQEPPKIVWIDDPDPSRAGWIDSADRRFRVVVVPSGLPVHPTAMIVLYDYGPNAVGRVPDGRFWFERQQSMTHAKAAALRRPHSS